MPLRVLVVAGDRDLPAGFPSQLGANHDEWQFSFASDARDALSALDESSPHVVIASDRAEIHGVNVLELVRERHPGTSRILLSADSVPGPAIKCGGAAQICLPVPLRLGQIEAVLDRAARLNDLLADAGMRALVGRLKTVPALPETYRQVVAELESPETSVSRVGEIVSRDAAMTAKVLQVANSAFFAPRREIADPTKAVVQIGLDVTRALVLTAGVFSVVKVRLHCHEIDSLWNHSLDTSLLARRIASLESADQAFVECAFTGALLHDFGKLILAANLPDDYAAVLADAESTGEALHAAESRSLGATHAAVGAYLAGIWGLPARIVCAVACHHGPFHGSCDALDAAGVVHVADVLDHERRSLAQEHGVALDPALLADAAFTARVERWRALREATDFGGGH